MKRSKLSALAAVALFAVACADPAGPTRTLLSGVPDAALIADPNPTYPFPSTTTHTEPTETDGVVVLCKVSNVAGTFGFSVTTPGGVSQVSITVAAGQVNTPVCHSSFLWNSDLPANQSETVTIVEDDPGANTSVNVDIYQHYLAAANYGAVNPLNDTFDNTTRTASVVINDDLEKQVYFTNTFSRGGEGCTPGFWKNNADKKGASQWPVATSTLFSGVFGANDDVAAGTTLLQALNLGGGGAKALARHAAAAYLNSLQTDVDYYYTTTEVVDMVAAALASNNYEATKNLLADANEAGCSISQNP